MSFPVPTRTRYNLTDAKNETVVVYNDGREEALLPWVDGAGGGEALPFEVLNTWTFTPEEDITSRNPITFEIPRMKNVCFLLLTVGNYPQTPFTTIYNCFAVFDGKSSPDFRFSGGGGALSSSGSGTSTGTPTTQFANGKISVNLPIGNYILTAGVKYALIAIKLGDMI